MCLCMSVYVRQGEVLFGLNDKKKGVTALRSVLVGIYMHTNAVKHI